MRKIYIVAVLFFVLFAVVNTFAQEIRETGGVEADAADLSSEQASDSSVNSVKYEVGVSVGVGISTMFLRSTYLDVKGKPNVSSLLSFNGAYNFTDNWAITAGLELFYSSVSASGSYIRESTSEEFESEGRFMNIDFISELYGLREKSNMLHLQLAVMARYQIMPKTSGAARLGYYGALGLKTGGGVQSRYSAQADRLVLTGNSEAFAQFFEDIERHNFTTVKVDRKNRQNIVSPNIALALEAGVKLVLNNRSSIYFGVFCDYNVSNYAVSKEKIPLISFNGDRRENGEVFNYTGVLNSIYSKKSGISRLSTGVRVSYVFNVLYAPTVK